MPFLDELWVTLEGYPGLQSPDVKDYLVKYQIPIGFFWTAYPDSTVDRIQKGRACARRPRADAGRRWLILSIGGGRFLAALRVDHERMRPLLR